MLMFGYTTIQAQNPNSNPIAQAPWKLNDSQADSTQFVGTTNDVDLVFKRNNIESFRLLEDFTMQGKLVLSEKTNTTTTILDVSSLARGTYLIKLTVANTFYKQIFVKE